MTTESQTQANRKNAKRSTGPKTAGGKALVACNAIKHGVFSLLPFIPGIEREDDWEMHRAGIMASLAPVGQVESCLAEQVALLMWRIGRVVRYETATIATGLDSIADGPRHGKFTAKRLAKLAVELTEQRGFLARMEAAVDAFRRLEEMPDGETVSSGVAYKILEAACNEVPEDAEQVFLEDEEFLIAIGMDAGDEFDELPWTGALFRRGLAFFVKHTGIPLEKLTRRMERRIEEHRTNVAKYVAELAAKLTARRAKRRTIMQHRQAHRILPETEAEGKVLRYENHLNRQLFQTLHELERMQASRAGRPVPPPLAVDVGVSVSGNGNGSNAG